MQAKTILFLMMILVADCVYAVDTHWSAKVKWVSVNENESANIALTTPYAPNPNTAIWVCSNGIVALSIKNMPAPKNMLSTALTLYATQKTVRLGVRGSGVNCEAWYLSARE